MGKMIKIFKWIVWSVIGGFFLLVLGVLLITPAVNDNVAKKVAKDVKRIELPSNTEYIESFSYAGKVAGNGNGMDYLGGILIKSDSSLQDLEAYYSQFEEVKCRVDHQTEQKISFVEYGNVVLNEDIQGEGYYIVYSWGEDNSIFADLDLRGH